MDRTLRPALVAEAIGTFIFFTVGAGAVVVTTYAGGGGGLVGVALAHGLVLAVLVSAFGAVSGGHFNPAVTAAVLVAGKIPAARAGWYIVAQAAGALAAGLLLRAVFSEAVWSPTHLGTPALGTDITPAMGIIIELVTTLLLVFAVLGTAVDPARPEDRRAGHRAGHRRRHPLRRPPHRRGHEPGALVRAGRRGRLLRRLVRLARRAAGRLGRSRPALALRLRRGELNPGM